MLNKIPAIVLFIILLPVFLFVSIFILISDGFPILFHQKKYGLNNKKFNLYKFRTMKNGTPILPTEKFNDANNFIIYGGKFMRKYSIDELPQLFNILIGDMNFIGPRPCMTTDNEKIVFKKRTEKMIHTIKPGITGWAQVNGRDLNSFDKKVELDFYYFKNKNFLLNVKILFLTIYVVLFKKDEIKH